ncbi:MAG: S-layer homology domain-containing protein [Clostridiales Family XIII bacterium]|jgi:hypothetical protein|nr:S-layer homology domain-containing protein [Clostridiales Family XIII bacterium]
MTKKMLTAALSAAIIAATGFTAPFCAFGAGYSDVPEGHWAHGYISALSSAGAIAGFPDGGFRPGETVSYGEFIKMALLAAGGADPGNAASGNWAAPYYEAAIAAGHFTDSDIARQALPFAIPREYMALIISNILGDTEIADYSRVQEGISDINHRSRHEYDITKVYAAGIITGYPDKTFRPDGSLTRAEAAAAIYRLGDEGARALPTLPPKPSASGSPSTWDRYVNGEHVSAGFVNVVKTSQSTAPISDMIDTIEVAGKWYTLDAPPEMYKKLKYYEVMYDYPYEPQIVPDLVGSVSIRFDSAESICGTDAWLIKGRHAKRLEGGDEIAWVQEDIGITNIFPDYDYIGFLGIIDDDTMVLLPKRRPS